MSTLYQDLIKNKTPDIRHLFDMKEVIFDKEWLEKQENIELYYMYRGLGLTNNDKQKIESARLRYDITVIPPLTLGKEFNKTAGHYHGDTTKGISYPEIYEVLEGEAYYLMQSIIKDDSVNDTYFVHAIAGDKVIIPPNYGHFTINASNKNLVMANWVCLDCISDYDKVKEKRGACYYAVLKNKIDEKNWIPNKNYFNIPELRKLNPTDFHELGLEKDKEMYKLVDDLEKLNFLVQPEKYEKLWKKILNQTQASTDKNV